MGIHPRAYANWRWGNPAKMQHNALLEHWMGSKAKSDGVGIFVAEKWVDSVISTVREYWY